jgi:N-acetylgalactosamine-6-sulfatase
MTNIIQSPAEQSSFSTRRTFISSALSSIPLFAQRESRPPNIVLFLADDLGWGDLTINGCSDIRTPNIDAIARNGVRFTQSYASAPECTPTRTALLTGRYQQRVGGLECAIGVNNIGRYDEAAWLQERGELGLPSSERTLAMQLRDRGYDTACIGKWHLGYLEKFWPNQHGFEEWFGILGGNADYFTHEEQGEGSGKVQLYDDGRPVRRKGYLTDLFAARSIDWLKERNPQKPFFLYLPFTSPHSPIQAAEDFDAETGTAPHRNRHRPTYGRMVERMDARIGEILGQLETQAVLTNTLVVFASDNGADANGSNRPYRGSKSTVWEGGIRAPLHMQWNGRIRAKTETSQVALTMDLAPTLLGAAGENKARTDGMNLMPVIAGSKPVSARTVFWRYKRADRRRKAVRSGTWKYLNDSGVEGLFELSRDPGEADNLLKSQPEKAAELKNQLATWERDVRAPRLAEFRARTASEPGQP